MIPGLNYAVAVQSPNRIVGRFLSSWFVNLNGFDPALAQTNTNWNEA